MECVIPRLDFNSSINGALKDSTGAVYYGEKTDTSIGCWSTNYLTALVQVIVTGILIAALPKRESAQYWFSASRSYKFRTLVRFLKKFVVPFPYHHRIFIAIAFLFTGLSQIFSGIQHQESCASQKPCMITFNVMSNVCLCLSGAYFINFTLALIQNVKVMSKIEALMSSKENRDGTPNATEDRLTLHDDADDEGKLLQSGADREVIILRQYLKKWMVAYLVIIFIYILLAAILSSMKILSFSVYGVIGSALPFLLMVIVTGVYEIINGIGCTAARSCYFLLLLSSFVIAVGGFGFQMMVADKCGVTCPVDCPSWIPVPNFNHNAVFHMFLVVSNILSGIWACRFCKEIESDMAPYYKRLGCGENKAGYRTLDNE